MATPLRNNAPLKARLTSEQSDFIKEYAARSDTDMFQVVSNYISKLEQPEKQRRREEETI